MKITIITLFPDMIRSFFEESIIKRAHEKGEVEIEIVNLRDFARDSYGSVDDRPYGGGAGMVMRVDVVSAALKSITHPSPSNEGIPHIILTSAKGMQYDQKKAQELAKLEHVIIVCGHYEGFDERILDYVDEEVSLGDFVMTGGEIAAAAIADSVTRLLPGVLKKEEATVEESFFEIAIEELIGVIGITPLLTNLQNSGFLQVTLLEYPQYTRPAEFEGKTVPDVIMNGHHAEIQKWRLKKAYEETVKKRPDLLDKSKNQ